VEHAGFKKFEENVIGIRLGEYKLTTTMISLADTRTLDPNPSFWDDLALLLLCQS